MSTAPLYTWSVTDHRKGGRVRGETTSPTAAKAEAEAQLRRIGRGLNGVSATVFRPSGGGWFARQSRTLGNFTWEAWEPA